MATYQQKIGISVDQKQVSKLIVNLKFIEKKIRKLNQTSLNLGRVRTRSRNIRGTGRNTSTSENTEARKNATDKVKKQVEALGNANKALNKYVQDLSKADGAQRGFAGSTNKINTQVSALKDRLKGLTRSNSEYRSTLQAVQRGEQALFQDRNKRLRDQANSLGRRGEKGGTGDLVTSLLDENVVQSIDGLNNYVSRLNDLRDTVKINSTAFEQLSQKIVQVNEALEKTQFKKVKETTQKKFPQTELGSPQEFQQRQQFAEQRKVIEEQIANTTQRINDSKLQAVTKEKLLNDLKRSGLKIEENQFKVAKEINIQTQKNLASEEKILRRKKAILNSTLIGGGFPLLFGGGPLQAAAGAIGGNIGERASQGGGFGGSIAATAVIGQIQQFAEASRQLGNSLKDANLGLEKLEELGFKVDQSTKKQIQSLLESGKIREAENLVNQKFANIIGPKSVKNLQDLDTSFDKLQQETSTLFLKLSAELAPAFTTIINLVTTLSKILPKLPLKEIIGQLSPGFQISNIPNEIQRFRESGGGRIGKLFGLKPSQSNNDLSTGLTDISGGSGGSKTLSFSKQELAILNARIDLQKTGDNLLNEEVVAKKRAVIEAERLLAVAQAQGDQGKINIADAQATLKNNELDTAVKEKTDSIIKNTIGSLKEEQKILEDTFKLGKDKADIEKRIRDLIKDLPPERHKEVRDLVEGNAALRERNELTDKYKITLEEINNVLASNMTDAVMGLIDGTKTLSESLSGIARQLASLFLNRAFSAMFGGFFGEQGGYLRSGSFKAFQYGGVVSSPTLGMIGEGGEPEYVIPSSKMDGAMARYSAGARGGAVIPGGSGASGTVAGSSGNTIVEYTGPVLNFNGDEYVPKDSVPQIINAAAKQGATLGQSRTLNTLKNSRSSRAKIGI